MPAPQREPIAISVLGARVHLACADETAEREVRAAWGDALVEVDDRELTPEAAGHGAAAPLSVPHAVAVLTPTLNTHLAHTRATELLLLRAAAVACPDTGTAVIVLAGSVAERTAAVSALAGRMLHLSHDLVGVAADGTLATYHSPLIGEDGTATAPSALPMGLAAGNNPVGALVVLHHERDHVGPPVTERLDTLDTFTALAPHTASLSLLPHPLQRMVELSRVTGGATRITCADPADLAEVIGDVLAAASPSRPPAPPVAVEPDPEVSDAAPAGTDSNDQTDPASTRGPLARGHLVDLYEFDGGAAVLARSQVVVLSEFAAAILAAVPTGTSTTLENLTATLIDQFGEPPEPQDAASLVREHVDHLVRHGILSDATAPLVLDTPRPVLDALYAALAHAPGEPTRWTLPEGVGSDDFVAAVQRHRVLHSVAERLDGYDLPRSMEDQLRAMEGQQRDQGDQLAYDMLRVVDVLEGAHVRTLVFKGAALAVQAYGAASARGAGDVDVLIAPGDVAAARSALLSHGASASAGYPTPEGPWSWRHLVWTEHELPLTWGETAIDLHWHLTRVHGAQPTFEDLWARRATVDLHGREVATLGPYDALAHSAGHAAKDHWRWMRSLVDVHRLASQPGTWQAADRPLRPDERVSVGLAVRALGRPAGAPPVVDQCVLEAAPFWDELITRQSGVTELSPPGRIPGVATLRAARSVLRAHGTPGDLARLVSHAALPAHLTSSETSPYALVAVPRVLSRRTRQLANQIGESVRGRFPVTHNN